MFLQLGRETAFMRGTTQTMPATTKKEAGDPLKDAPAFPSSFLSPTAFGVPRKLSAFYEKIATFSLSILSPSSSSVP